MSRHVKREKSPLQGGLSVFNRRFAWNFIVLGKEKKHLIMPAGSGESFLLFQTSPDAAKGHIHAHTHANKSLKPHNRCTLKLKTRLEHSSASLTCLFVLYLRPAFGLICVNTV